MRVKTSELIGPQLDWAVITAGKLWETAHLLYPTMTLDPTFSGVGTYVVDGCVWLQPSNPLRQDPKPLSPSAWWEHGGPVAEKAGISCVTKAYLKDPLRKYMAYREQDSISAGKFGHTELVAKMRCYVASEIGDEIDIPDELCEVQT